MALLLGLTLGVAQAGLRGRLDDRLRSIEEAEPYLRSSALALIPSIPGLDQRGSTIGFSRSPGFDLRCVRSTSRELPRRGLEARRDRVRRDERLIRGGEIDHHRPPGEIAGTRRSEGDRDLRRPREASSRAICSERPPISGSFRSSRDRFRSARPCCPTSAQPHPAALRPADRRRHRLSQATGDRDAVFDSIRERSGFVLVDSPPLGDPDAVSLLPFVDGVLFVVDCRRMHGQEAGGRSSSARPGQRRPAGYRVQPCNCFAVIRPEPRRLAAAGSSRP